MSGPRQMMARMAGAALCVALASQGVIVGTAVADTAPHEGTPATVSNDLLPTPQIDGVVWDQAVAGGFVFAGGNFTKAWPFKVPPGKKDSPRHNLLSYDLKTGKLSDFAPKLNGQVKTVTASPDGKTIYVGGLFTEVGKTKRYRLAAFDVASGKLVESFKPVLNYVVNDIAVSGNSVYVGGAFSSSGSHQRKGLAAFNATTGALLKWAPKVTGGQVLGVAISPDAKKLVAVGQFDGINGEALSGWGAVSTETGEGMEWQGKNWLKAAGKRKGIYSISSDANRVYVTAFSDGEDNFEGVAAANWSNGSMSWILDCHGDSYDTAPMGDTVYWVSHAHSCESVGHKPESNPWTYMRANALSAAPSKKGTKNEGGDFPGKPAPDILHWYPKIEAGTFTKTNQGAWTVETSDGYVLLGGEFPVINGVRQQGLARFAVSSKAPNKSGPVVPPTGVPVVWKQEGNKVTALVRSVWDRDNEHLKYSLVRNGKVIDEKVASSIWFKPGSVTLTDAAMPEGNSHPYLVVVTDQFGNRQTSGVKLLGEGPLLGDPNKPLDPVKPEDPKPVDPDQPADPVKPQDPKPVDPDQPADPVKPQDPKPVDPDQPADPVKPQDPKPVDPDQPADPVKPQDPKPGGWFGGGFLDGLFKPITDFFKGIFGGSSGPDRLFGPGGLFF